jgi:hypothetical protein
MNITIPAKYRTAFYWLVAVVAGGVTIATGLDIIPTEAVERGVAAGGLILGFLGSVLALFNITPDE